MTKAETKQLREQLMHELAERTRHKLWNPDLPAAELAHFREVSAAYFAHMDTLALPCALPRVVEGREHTEATPTLSHVGGEALWPTSVAWPTDHAGRPLTLAIEIHIAELPFVPLPLGDVAVLQVFVGLEPGRQDPAGRRPQEPPQYTGVSVIHAHAVSAAAARHEGAPLPRAALTWESALSFPGYPDALDVVDSDLESAFSELPGCHAMAAERSPSILGSHVGGWPGWLTGSDVGEFVVQLDGETLGVDLGFDGQLYVGRRNGEWVAEWEIG
jgi:hypothetical protein